MRKNNFDCFFETRCIMSVREWVLDIDSRSRATVCTQLSVDSYTVRTHSLSMLTVLKTVAYMPVRLLYYELSKHEQRVEIVLP